MVFFLSILPAPRQLLSFLYFGWHANVAREVVDAQQHRARDEQEVGVEKGGDPFADANSAMTQGTGGERFVEGPPSYSVAVRD